MLRETKIEMLKAVFNGSLLPSDINISKFVFIGCNGMYSLNGCIFNETELKQFEQKINQINQRRAALNLPLDTITVIVEQD